MYFCPCGDKHTESGPGVRKHSCVNNVIGVNKINYGAIVKHLQIVKRNHKTNRNEHNEEANNASKY